MLPNYHRRNKTHDYHRPYIYHITINKDPSCPDFGSLAGDIRIAPGLPGSVRVDRSPIGKIIQKEIFDFPAHHPEFQVYQYIVMPDHLHILLRVKVRLPYPLGHYIGLLKGAITAKVRSFLNSPATTVFTEGFNDREMHPGRRLDTVFKYIRENPHRLAVRQQRPEFFRRLRNLTLFDKVYTAYGNPFLLRSPFKSNVIIHRSDTESEKARKHETWMRIAATGGVLVSPFISKAEQTVRHEAENLGGRFILLRHEGMGERYKPAEHDFDLCCQGRLLIISPADSPLRADLSRKECLQMNTLAKSLCKEEISFL